MSSEQIPEDVLELAAKAGVNEAEWYSGRFDIPEPGSAVTDQSNRRSDLHRIVQLDRQTNSAPGPLAFMMALPGSIATACRRARAGAARRASQASPGE